MLRKRGIYLRLLPTVFHPNFYLSTDILLDYVTSLEIDQKRVLELGCGNGFISLYLAKNHHTTTFSSDINPKAIEGIIENAPRNEVTITAMLSDLFDEIPSLALDYILINPPFYPKTPESTDEHAFYAGANLEYFEKLFEQVKSYLAAETMVLMILSENVPLGNIQKIGRTHQVALEQAYSTQKNKETFFVYQLGLT